MMAASYRLRWKEWEDDAIAMLHDHGWLKEVVGRRVLVAEDAGVDSFGGVGGNHHGEDEFGRDT